MVVMRMRLSARVPALQPFPGTAARSGACACACAFARLSSFLVSSRLSDSCAVCPRTSSHCNAVVRWDQGRRRPSPTRALALRARRFRLCASLACTGQDRTGQDRIAKTARQSALTPTRRKILDICQERWFRMSDLDISSPPLLPLPLSGAWPIPRRTPMQPPRP